ncbi:outer membrane beta-barrel protein [Aureispira sp. CCB-E]|uniref:outer membrane beta-barrel protein n=1 Tax=Aureispira sp. CCB-E TaxID=3051121 RepID=UPI0028685188|nr:hypothetical protein [Aureispira sp. CCB-E]WMX15675.1 hypothetical protein QP953_04680 [Aureispira sp. CCB-E]
MDLERKIKNHLKNTSSLEGLDVNDLWNNIEKGLEENKVKQSSLLSNKNLLLGALILLFILSGILWILFYNNSNTFDNSRSTLHLETNVPSNHSYINPIATLAKQASNLPIAHNTSNNQLNNNLFIPKNTAFPKNQSTQIVPYTSHSTNVNQLNNQHISTFQNRTTSKGKTSQKAPSASYNTKLNNYHTTTPKNTTSSEDQSTQINSPTSDNTNESQLNNHSSSTINKNAAAETLNWNKGSKKIKTLDIQNLSIQLPLEQKHTTPELTDAFFLNKRTNRTKFNIGSFLGLHTIKNIFFAPSNSNNIGHLLNEGYQYELGTSIGVEVEFYFYKNLFVLTGFEYNQSMSEFNSTQSWGITRANPISPTGYSNATATRVVKHHNKMTYYAIPLFLGIQKSIGRLNYGISLGIHFNFTQSQKGKTLDQYNNIVMLETEATPFPVSKFFISYSCRPFISYKINKNITIQLRVDGRYQNYGFSDLYQLNHAAVYMGLGLGAQFKF